MDGILADGRRGPSSQIVSRRLSLSANFRTWQPTQTSPRPADDAGQHARRWCILRGGGLERRRRFCCGRSVALLYIVSNLFSCRQCNGLAYRSQRIVARHRAISRARKIRLKLGGSASVVDEFPERPKGMHTRTYNKLRRSYLKYLALSGGYNNLRRLLL